MGQLFAKIRAKESESERKIEQTKEAINLKAALAG
jgi:hypothetical protein